MENPLWGPDETPLMANFVNRPHIRPSDVFLATSWNQLEENPPPGTELAFISICASKRQIIYPKSFHFESFFGNNFMFDRVITSFRKLRHN